MRITRNLSILLIFITLGIFVAGCDGEDETQDNLSGKQDTAGEKEMVEDNADTTGKNNTDNDMIGKEPEIQWPDITGEWKGTFDGRPFTLNITSQDGDEFSGNTTISTREIRENQVDGSFDKGTRKLKMVDQQRSRYKGTYNGSFDDNFTQMSGTFTYHTDKSKANFTLKKQ